MTYQIDPYEREARRREFLLFWSLEFGAPFLWGAGALAYAVCNAWPALFSATT